MHPVIPVIIHIIPANLISPGNHTLGGTVEWRGTPCTRFRQVSSMDETTGQMKQLFVFEHKARRLELLIRIFYSIAIAIVMFVYGLIAGILMFIQWFVILILGRRSEGLSDFIKGYLEYHVHVLSYTSWMTDERPGILPKSVTIFSAEIPEQKSEQAP